jgi:type IV secretory pathway ATPase VirB11/archaellum biosynthesis ATPase
VLTLDDMVANGTISDKGAEVLRGIGSTGRSFLVYAGPRNAGKTTLTNAILAEAPAILPRDEFNGTGPEVESLSAAPTRGYLLVGEIGHRGRRGYLAREEVTRLFQLLDDGYSLASSLHAESVDEVFDVLQRNGIAPAAAAAAIDYFIRIRALGDPHDPATQRVVEQIDEITSPDSSATRSPLYQRDAALPD